MYRDVLDPERAELERAPCMLTVLPSRAEGWKALGNLTNIYVNVSCWCEHPDGPHPIVPIGSNRPPDYELKLPRQWLVTAAPFISWAATLFKALVPVAGTALKQGVGELLDKTLKDRIDLMAEVAKALPSGKLEVGSPQMIPGMLTYPLEIVSLRHIHDALIEQVPKAARWGDLRPVRTKAGELLWLCAQHADVQRPPVQEIP